jgi:hypothetical protein
MKSYQNDTQIVRDRQRQFMRAADTHRLIQMAQVYRPSMGGRILASLGGWMIASGTRLRERYTQVASYQLPVTSQNEAMGLYLE